MNAYEEQIELLMSQWDSRLAELDQMQTDIQAVKGVGAALDGLLTIEVGPGGALREAHVDPKAMRVSSRDLAEAIIEAAHAANADAAAKMADLLEPVLHKEIDVAGLLDGDTALRLPDSVNQSMEDATTRLRDLARLLGNPPSS